ncbi:hypothetical protein GF377_00155 [candidate division GN15 bacterium]|nr:hypothetical protein [candidate division GN15 bacterium]
MRVLGISCFYHDAAAALVIDNQLVAAVSQERFSGIKHDPELPVAAVRWCLDRAGFDINHLDYIVFYDKPLTKFERIVTGYMANPWRSFRAFLEAMPIWLGRKLWTEQVIQKELGYAGEILYTPHHLAHAAGTYYASPFDRAACLTIDGVGEWATASFGIGSGNRVELTAQMNYPHSVGLLYSAFTYYLGFRVNSAEYKIMGLAAFGTPRFAELIEQEMVRIFDDGSIALNLKYFTYHFGLRMTGARFEKLFGRPRRQPKEPLDQFHKDIAASLQQVTEKIVMRMARHVRKQTGMTRLCLSGGVALNCAATGKLLQEGVFDDIYVQPAAGDAGGAAGAALYTSYLLTDGPKVEQPFFGLGPSFETEAVRQFFDDLGIPYSTGSESGMAKHLAQRISESAIVAVYQGSMEFGPRALGFRSILADPRNPDMKSMINAAVKYREPFRPFAPAVMREKVSEWFQCDRDAPYMVINFPVREDKRSVIPAVTHADGSARIQTVAVQDNPVLYRVLQAFDELTGVPVLLNTSFNLRGYPIVNTPREAFATFCSGGIDILYLGDLIVDKEDIPDRLITEFAMQAKAD